MTSTLFAWCHETWTDMGLPLASLEGSGGVHEEALDSKVVMESHKASGEYKCVEPLPNSL
ncbi:hypothetical protein F5X98DRAFT_359231 [Xylaria grammica]|nr:hypothetical protein F5X98DRAFT_359231 [Xylaria grammica]